NFGERVSDDALTSLANSEESHTLSEEMGNEIVSSLLSSVVPTTNDEALVPQQQLGIIQNADGQILFLTYIINPALSTGDELDTSQLVQSNESSQRMVLHVTDDGSTMVLPAECIGDLDIIGTGDNGILPQWTVNGLCSLIADSSLPQSLEQNSDAKDVKENENVNQCSFIEINNRRRTEQLVGSDLHIEEKLEVLDAMLTPVPERSRKKKSESGVEDAEGNYMCDLCENTFPRASQFYGHLHSHSGERKWECTICPEKLTFTSQSQLRRHEKDTHLNLRPHICPVCSARFDRVSQLNYHQRRIHAGERAHACQICSKAFFKRSDLKTHLNIHLGINKCICEICGKKFNHVSNLIRHTRMHSGIKPYPCTVCGRRFTQLNALNQHKTSHLTNKNVSCSICNKMFKSHLVMRKHVRQLHRDKLVASGKDLNAVLKMKEGAQSRRFYCKVCGKDFEFAALLKQHEREHEKENDFHCNCCGQTPEQRLQKEAENKVESERVAALNTQLESLLQEHSDIVGGEEERNNLNGNSELMGEIIIYVTAEGQDEPTQVHIRTMADPLTGQSDGQKSLLVVPNAIIRIETTDMLWQKKGENKQKMLLLNSTEEDNCLTATFDGSLTDPLQLPFSNAELSQSNNNRNNIQIQTSENTSSLYSQHVSTSDNSIKRADVLGDPTHDSDCDNVISNSVANIKVKSIAGMLIDGKLNLQEKSSLDNSAAETTVPASGKKHLRIYQCPECPKSFVKNSNFKQHLGIHFIDQQRYRCPTCGQSFAWKSTLNKHMMNHSTGPLPRYGCDLCDKEYAAATQVLEHIKRDHYKQRPHACLACGKTFYKKYDLKIHLRTHTKERPYICGTCGKSFYHLSHIIRHERIHSGHRPYQCPDCGRQFNQSSSLKSHSYLTRCQTLKTSIMFSVYAEKRNLIE
ncbi:hypothetical protein L9F63_026085, partial [Diploptera punctata]